MAKPKTDVRIKAGIKHVKNRGKNINDAVRKALQGGSGMNAVKGNN